MLTALTAFLLAPACSAEGPPVVVAETVQERPWRYATDDFSVTRFALIAGERPFLGGEGKRLGKFDYDWDIALRLDKGTNTVSRACFETRYEVYFPYMPTRRLERCFGRQMQVVAAHEERHVEITRQVIAAAAESLVGASREDALIILENLDPTIVEANLAFHERAEGQKRPRFDKKRGC